MINKISYRNSPDDDPEIKTPGPEEVESISSERGARGSTALVEMTSEFDDSSPEIEESNKQNILNKSAEDKIINMLINISDELDHENLETYADFSDFLIEKFASALNFDPTDGFNEIILKIKRSDISNTSDIIKKLTKIYSRTILIEYMKNKNMNKSKESAYKKIVHRAGQYLSES